MTVLFCFTKRETRYDHGIFTTGFRKVNPVVKIPWSYRRSYLEKTKSPSFDSQWFCLPYGAFVIVHSLLVTLTWLNHRDSTISGINPGEGPDYFLSMPNRH